MSKNGLTHFRLQHNVSDTLEHIYPEGSKRRKGGDDSEPQHKEESFSRRKADDEDRDGIRKELTKHSHPLKDQSNHLYNIITGQIASDDINVAEALSIGRQMKAKFTSGLPEHFHSSISSPVKTMESMKKGTKAGSSVIYSMETIFLRLLTVGQTRQVQLAPVFEFELCAVPPSLIDEFGCLRTCTWQHQCTLC